MFGSRIDAMKLVEKLTGVTDHAENRQALLKLPDAWFHESVKGGVRVCEVNLPNARKVVEQVEHTVTKEFRKEFNRIIDTVVYGSSEFIASVDVDFVDFRAEGPILGEVADDNFDVVELAGTAVRIVKEGDNKGLIDAKSLVKAMTAQDSTKARQVAYHDSVKDCGLIITMMIPFYFSTDDHRALQLGNLPSQELCSGQLLPCARGLADASPPPCRRHLVCDACLTRED